MIDYLKKTIKSLYDEFVLMKDTPHNIALGFAVGVFLGILPFTGVLAAIGVALFFRLNKAGAILGSALTNTWVSFLILAAAIQLSCGFLGLSAQQVQLRILDLFKNFSWLKVSGIWEILLSVAAGFLILSILLSMLSYFLCLGFIYIKKPRG